MSNTPNWSTLREPHLVRSKLKGLLYNVWYPFQPRYTANKKRPTALVQCIKALEAQNFFQLKLLVLYYHILYSMMSYLQNELRNLKLFFNFNILSIFELLMSNHHSSLIITQWLVVELHKRNSPPLQETICLVQPLSIDGSIYKVSLGLKGLGVLAKTSCRTSRPYCPILTCLVWSIICCLSSQLVSCIP